MHSDDRPFRQYIQLVIGDNGGHFDNVVDVWAQARHLEVHPNQRIRQLTHPQRSFSIAADGSKR